MSAAFDLTRWARIAMLSFALAVPCALSAQAPGDRVRVVRPSDGSIVLSGRFERASTDSVWLIPAGRSDAVGMTLGGGARLERSLGRRGHALTGALIGAGVGTVAAVLFWSGFCGGDNYCDGDEELRIAAVFIITPAVAGAGIGALIKSERWAPVVTVRPAPGGGAFGLGVTIGL